MVFAPKSFSFYFCRAQKDAKPFQGAESHQQNQMPARYSTICLFCQNIMFQFCYAVLIIAHYFFLKMGVPFLYEANSQRPFNYMSSSSSVVVLHGHFINLLNSS
jgi:hypothetical protein